MRSLMVLALLAVLGCKDEPNEAVDNDGDAFTAGVDCDDNDASINPNAEEICDDIDNNCDGAIDEGLAEGRTQYPDTDGDGFGDANSEPVESCATLEGHVENNSDCDDNDASINPDAAEICDMAGVVDEDCDGLIDDEDPSTLTSSQTALYVDLDGDGYGALGTDPLYYCDAPPEVLENHAENDLDCDDTNVMTYTGAPEVCDGQDNNCDESLADEAGLAAWTPDGGSLTNFTPSTDIVEPTLFTFNESGILAVCPGTYYVNFTVNADVSFIGYGTGPNAVTLSGAGAGTVLSITDKPTDIRIDGVSIADGVGTTFLAGEVGDSGGGVLCRGSAHLDIKNTHFRNNFAEHGAAIASEGCDLQIDSSAFYENTGETITANSGLCAAIVSFGGKEHSITNTDFFDNYGYFQAGICYGTFEAETVNLETNNVQIYDNEISGDYALGYVYFFGEEGSTITASLTDTAIFDNTAPNALSSYGYGTVFIDGNETTITWDKTPGNNSGIYGNDSPGLTAQADTLTITGTDLDLGDNGTDDENPRYDLSVSDEESWGNYRAEDGTTFYCEGYKCVNNSDGKFKTSKRAVYTVGTTSGEYTTGSSLVAGTIFKGENNQTLDHFSLRYSKSSACTYDMYLFSAMDTDSDGDVSDEMWEVVWRRLNAVHAGGGWRNSETLGVLLPPTKEDINFIERDMYYAPAVGWTCTPGGTPATAYYDTVTSASGDLGIGQSWGRLMDTSYDATWPYSVGTTVQLTAEQSSATTPDVYLLTIDAIDLNGLP